jgi:sn-glycerol 3-phosphate transport system permease protein
MISFASLKNEASNKPVIHAKTRLLHQRLAAVSPDTTLVIATFFYWPAVQALFQSFTLADPFGQRTQFVWFDNFIYLFRDHLYWKSIGITFFFSFATALMAISVGLLIAAMANRALKAKAAIRTLLIWPYAIAPAISGIVWLFLFHPSYGVIAYVFTHWLGIDWNPILNGTDALALVIVASAWKQISYNFVFFMAGLQSIPKSLIEAAAIDGASPFRRFWVITFPLLSPTLFFLMVQNIFKFHYWRFEPPHGAHHAAQ